MALRYAHWSPAEVVADVETHVRAHLSTVADPDDDPTTYADQVRVSHKDDDGGVLVTGELDAEANAPYLRPGFTPEDDIAANPLTVEPMGGQS